MSKRWSNKLKMTGICFLNAAMVLAFAALLTPPATAQNTIHVPLDQPTIQQAIAAAQNGDTVLVAPGTYRENIDFLGKAIAVTSSEGRNFTIIDGGNAGSVVTFKTGETTSSVLDGFTITNGNSDTSHAIGGGGIAVMRASPTIQNNEITGNKGCDGIGVYISFGSPVIRNNGIDANTEGGDSGCRGGGIFAGGAASSAQIVNNVISANSMPNGFAGGIELFSVGQVLLSRNVIASNSAYDAGAMEIVNASSAIIVDNLIVKNTSASGEAGGVSWIGPSDSIPSFLNNTVAMNDGKQGSAFYFSNFHSPAKFSNNLFIGLPGEPAVYCDVGGDLLPSSLDANDIWTSGSPIFAGSCADPTGSSGNISADPQFLSVTGADFSLQSSSPAIDAGDNSAANLPQTDLGGSPRVADGNGDCTATVDMGAYEFPAPSTPQAPSILPGSLNFGTQLLGTTSASQMTTLTGNGCIQISSIQAVTLAATNDFAQTNNCPQTLAKGASCTIQVTFTPSIVGPESGAIQVTGNFNGIDSQSLSGTGTGQAVATVSPTSLDFGGQPAGTTSAAQGVTLSNTGNITLQISNITLSPTSYVETTTCSGSLAPGASCSVSVSFSPPLGLMGTVAGTLSFTTNGGSASVSLTGVSLAPVPVFVPTSLNFGNQRLNTSGSSIVTLQNTGNGALNIGSVVVNGANFSQSNNCGNTLAAGASCNVTVTFAATVLGPVSGSLSLTSNFSGNAPLVALSGNGVAPAAALSPTTVSFPSLPLGTTSAAQIVTLSNSGTASLDISSIAASGDFAEVSTCPASLAAGGSCAIQVTFQPTATGPRSGALVILSDDPVNPQLTAVLTGTGSDFGIAASPSKVMLNAGHTAHYMITLVPLGGAFNASVALSCSGVPRGAACSLSPVSITPGGASATVALSVTTTSRHQHNGTPDGDSVITVTGAAGAIRHSTQVILDVE
jgi:hypothetical protein